LTDERACRIRCGMDDTTQAATPLRLFNSLTRQLEDFKPVRDGEARVYTCGPTVYNYPHIGNMRAYVFADTLGRVLRWKGYALKHVINITDVGHLTDDADAGEDKLEKAAAANAQSIWDIARHYTDAFKADVKALNITEPAQWTVATDYVPKMIEFAKGIADKHCYEIDSGLYFDVTTVPDYGRLARAHTDEGQSRIDPVPGKRNPQDFAIWRKTPAGEKRQMEWDSPWGMGAPGWHLECSVMSGAELGFPFDIHTGGIDHREIHHPCEIAQNQAHCHSAGSGATIWMHNNFLVDRRGKDGSTKMSKSSGEFLRLQTLVDRGFHPLSYRMLCLQAHYRSELEFTWEGLLAAQTRLKRLAWRIERIEQMDGKRPEESAGTIAQLDEAFNAGMCHDLTTPDALTVIDDLLLAAVGPRTKRDRLKKYDLVLGLGLAEITRADLRVRPATATLTEADIEAALEERKAARAAKDFATSDAIRDRLISQGVEVMDGDPLGWDWKPILD
jgi:cysteinyl-tRNA synthetase